MGPKLVVAVRGGVPQRLLAGPPPGARTWTVHLPDEPPAGAADLAAVVVVHLDGTDPHALVEGLGALDADAWLVEERPQWDESDHRRDRPEGTPSPGVTRVSFLRRAQGLTRDEFARHWTEVHAPLARRHHPTLWRYVQNVVVAPLTPGAPDVDGIAELGFPSRDDLERRAYDSPEGAAVLGADVRTFVELTAGFRLVGREVVVRGGPPGGPPAQPLGVSDRRRSS